MAFWEIDGDLWEIVRNDISSTTPHIGRSRCDPRRLFIGVLYVLITGCRWYDVLANYVPNRRSTGTHIELSEKCVYRRSSSSCSSWGTRYKRLISRTVRRVRRIFRLKRRIDRL
ncbi:MAG: hypothetical protein CVV31_04385 [Methanomicrobiales archaeon HGW-Methanomicrobiales-2]|nr:MAG: hypothetical protein CVV34_07480 [Methanomicrobiales archaeon HGW-Methanomicrobiales-5]PKL62798.1 MAG: hypothetical protein CVV31_04385 [Methanomicrobiales archaeon HGW-Methanomicrobiales-2]